MSLSGQNDKGVDALRLTDAEKDALITQMNRRTAETYGAELRQEERLPYQGGTGILLKLQHPGGSMCNYLVRPRNISSIGLGFLHGNFLYVGSRAHVQLITKDGDAEIPASGKIVRCQHVQGHVHEIGMRFDQPIDLQLFVNNCVRTTSDGQESVELPELSGNVLYADDLVDDQELLRYHLTNLGVDVTVAENGMEAMEKLGESSFDMVFTSVALPGMTGAEFTSAMREKGFVRPIIAVSPDADSEEVQQTKDAGCTDIVTKPFSIEKLIEICTEHLSAAGGAGGPLMSTEWGNTKMRPLIISFVSRLERNVRALESLLQTENNEAAIKKMCTDLKGSAGGYGYPDITRVATEMCELLDEQGELDALRGKFGELDQLTRSASVIRRDAQRG